MSTEPGKQYGLILPKKTNQDVIQRPAIFDEGSDSENSSRVGSDWIKKAYQRDTTKPVEKRQTKIQIQKALSQDPSIYKYDEIYDEIKEKINLTLPKKGDQKPSRYIQSLKRNAERRKLENERRLERQVQKERQEEGEEFKGKETFVTSSYKKKLEEFQKMDEEEKRIDRLEEIGDVSKQKDISGFYRHLYKTTVDVQPWDVKSQNVNEEQQEEKIELTKNKSPSKEQPKPLDTNKKQKRQYRKRTKSGSSREEGEKTTSSSSSSSSTSSSESEGEVRSKPKKREKEDKIQDGDKVSDKKKRSRSRGKESLERSLKSIEDTSINKKKKPESITDNNKIKGETRSENVSDVKSTVQEHKISVNLWLKRTVGTNFDDALRRYLERKSKRQASY